MATVEKRWDRELDDVSQWCVIDDEGNVIPFESKGSAERALAMGKFNSYMRSSYLTRTSPREESDQQDQFASFEKEWLDREIAEGVTNRDVCRSLMMLMGRMG